MIQNSNNISNNNNKDMDDSMSSCFLQLKVMYCKDLSAFNFFQKLSVYVVVTIESDDDPHKKPKDKDDPYQQQQRTPTDAEGDANPEWNHPMRFDLSRVSSFQHCDHLFLRFDIRHEGLYFGDKSIGQVRVPLKDLLIQHQHQKDGGIVKFVSYEVRSMDGKPCGVLHFSYQANLNGAWSKDSPNHTTHSLSIQISGYPMVGADHHHYHHQQQQQQQQSNEIHCNTSSPSSAVDSSSSPAEAYYPSLLDLEFNSQQLGTCSEHHHLHHQVHDDYQSLHLQGTPYPSQENRTSYYPPINAYYPPPPPPPPPPMMHQPPTPLPPPMVYHGACYHPPGFHPWAPGDYNYSTMQGQSHHTSVNEVRWPPNDFGAGRRDGYY